jgi:hypothetical protein
VLRPGGQGLLPRAGRGVLPVAGGSRVLQTV